MNAAIVDRLGALTGSTDPRVRTDVCDALALTGSDKALPYLQTCMTDPDPDVREAAQEAVESLGFDLT